MSPALYIPVGIPGCGKSTFAEKVLPLAHVISTDKIRAALGDVTDQSQNDLVFERFHTTVRDYLELSLPGAMIYADATNLTRSAREILRAIAADTRSPFI
jgi:predicted kinase